MGNDKEVCVEVVELIGVMGVMGISVGLMVNLIVVEGLIFIFIIINC